jgi:hypothetical protein
MRLSLDTRQVGRVTIVRCNGRIVAGSESESLRAHVTWLLRDRRAIVLHSAMSDSLTAAVSARLSAA